MKLWLDDERDPKSNKIQSLFGSDGDEVWVKTIEQAIYYLNQNVVESISLDHDLGYDKTGLDLANWIEEKAYNGSLERLVWSVHSLNSVGAKKITQAMRNADRYWSEKNVSQTNNCRTVSETNCSKELPDL